MKDIIQKEKDYLNKREDYLNSTEKIYKTAEGEVGCLGKITIKLLHNSMYPRCTWVELFKFYGDVEFSVEMNIFYTKFFANRHFNKIKEKYNLTDIN